MNKHAFFLMGPTAAGKTALAIELAMRLPIDIISVDSAMVYKGMDIGTGKPTASELASAPHKLIDICDPSSPYSAAQFCVDAKEAMQSAWDNNRIPFLVGGTMMYFKALLDGLSSLPSASSELRAELEKLSVSDMYTQLENIDPLAAKRFNCNDKQRIQRALEINTITGKTLQENFAVQKNINDFTVHSFAIMPDDRQELHKVIASRFLRMLDDGLVEEVSVLFNREDLNVNLPSIRAVGYRQVWNYLAGEINYETMSEQAIAATRQLAKRQYTWLRSWQNMQIVTRNDVDYLCQSVIKLQN